MNFYSDVRPSVGCGQQHFTGNIGICRTGPEEDCDDRTHRAILPTCQYFHQHSLPFSVETNGAGTAQDFTGDFKTVVNKAAVDMITKYQLAPPSVLLA